MSNIYIKKQLKNVEGKRLLTKTILEYSKEIIISLESNPELLISVLNELEISEEDFFAYLSGEKKGNITIYDQALSLIKIKNKKQ